MKNITTTFLFVGSTIFCIPALAQNPPPQSQSRPLTQEEAIGAVVGHVITQAGTLWWENELLRRQILNQSTQFEALKAEAEKLRKENTELQEQVKNRQEGN